MVGRARLRITPKTFDLFDLSPHQAPVCSTKLEIKPVVFPDIKCNDVLLEAQLIWNWKLWQVPIQVSGWYLTATYSMIQNKSRPYAY
jgi:hypothetical protein